MSKHNRHKTKNFSTASENVSQLKNIPDVVKPSYTEPLTPPTLSLGMEDSSKDPRFDVKSKKVWFPEIVTRSTVWDFFRTTISLPNPSDVLTKLSKAIEEFDSIICDARVKAAYNNRRSGLLSLQWTIDQNGASSRAFKIIKRVFDSLPITDIMSGFMFAPLYGYNVAEVTWEAENNLIVPKKIESKAARWFVYSDMNELRFKTKVNMVQGEPLPPRKFLVTRYHPRYDDPYAGREAIANAVYWPVIFRHMAMEFAVQFLEKYACPWLDVTIESDKEEEQKTEIANIIQNTYNQGVIVHNKDTVIQAMEIGSHKGVESYEKFIDLMNKEIDMAILGNNLSTEVKGGSFAATRAHMGVRDDIIQEDRRMVEATFNQLIEWVYWYNFNTNEPLPKFKLHKSEPATEERAGIDLICAQMGVKFNKEYFARVYGYNHEDFEIGEPPASKLSGSLPAGGIPTEVDPDGLALQNDLPTKGKDSDPDTEELDIGIESKEAASNPATKQAILRAQAKGYPY
jgi:hypothetical protein